MSGGYLSAADLSTVPRIEDDYFWLRPEDYDAWRRSAVALAVEQAIGTEHRARVAALIDQCPDPEIDPLFYRVSLWPELKALVPGIQSITEQAAAGVVGRTIRVQALTSAEWHQAQRAAGEDGLMEWYVIALGMHTPDLGGRADLADAAATVQQWPQTNVRLIARKIQTLTIHPGDQRKQNASDAFKQFFSEENSAGGGADTRSTSFPSPKKPA